MKRDLERAAALLKSGEYTCALVKGDAVYTSRERGVKPLMTWLAEKTVLSGFSAADKIVGKATAFLYVLLGVDSVYAPVVSKSASEVFSKHGIELICDAEVEAIRNRTNTGFCPMEQAVKGITHPADAPNAIREALEKMQ